MNDIKINNWREVFPELEKYADKLTRNLLDTSNVISMPENSTVFQQGEPCKNYPIVLDGKVKAFTRAENAREIVRYHLAKADSCF